MRKLPRRGFLAGSVVPPMCGSLTTFQNVNTHKFSSCEGQCALLGGCGCVYVLLVWRLTEDPV